MSFKEAHAPQKDSVFTVAPEVMVVVMKHCTQPTFHYILPIPAGNKLIIINNVGRVEGKMALGRITEDNKIIIMQTKRTVSSA